MTFATRLRDVLRALRGTTDAAPAPVNYRERPPVEPRRVGGMSEQDVAEATRPEPKVNPFTVPKSPPWLASSAGGIAMDSAGVPPALTTASLYQWASTGAFSEGLGFLGYPYLAELTQRPEYRRVSEIWAAEAVRKWIEFSGDPDRIKLVEKAMERFKVQDVIRHAIELDGFFGRAQIFPDLGYEFNSPELRAKFVPKAKVGVGALKGFNVIEPFWSYPGSYQSTNPLAADFYKPREWYVMGYVVDSSWLITIVGRPMPDLLKPAYAFGGLALSQMVKPYVDNWLRTRQSVSDLIHSFSTMVLKTNMATVIQGAVGGVNSLLKRIALFNRARDNRGVMAIDKDTEELENVSTPLGTLDKLQAQAQEQIASVAGIPLVVLLGVTPSGLNASSDGEIRTFYATIMGYLARVIKHPLQYMIDLIQLDIDGNIDPDLKWKFVDLWELPEDVKANVRKADAETDIAYVGAGVISNENVRTRITKDPDSIYYGMELEEPEPVDDPSLDDPLDDEPDDDDDQPPRGGLKLPKLPAQDAQFEENKHPRRNDGKFGSGGGGGGSAPSPASNNGDLPSPSAVRQPVKSYDELKTKGAEGLDQFKAALDDVAGKLGLKTDVDLPENLPADAKGAYLFVAPNKSEARAAAKVESDYGGDWSQLKDYIRASIACDTEDEARAAFEAVQAQGLKLAATPKDKFATPTPEGHRDLNTLVTLPNGMVAELQFHVKSMIIAKDEAHDYYAEQQKLARKNGSDRPNDSWDTRDAERFVAMQQEQQRIYGDAWAKATA